MPKTYLLGRLIPLTEEEKLYALRCLLRHGPGTSTELGIAERALMTLEEVGLAEIVAPDGINDPEWEPDAFLPEGVRVFHLTPGGHRFVWEQGGGFKYG